jgi:CspA family cold shock protein
MRKEGKTARYKTASRASTSAIQSSVATITERRLSSPPSTASFKRLEPNDGGNDVFVHISAVERAGLRGLAEGQKVSFEAKTDKMRGKTSAENLSLV